MQDAAFNLKNVEYSYDGESVVLDIPQLAIARKEKAFILGPSGCGKSTLLGVMTGILTPQKGQVISLGKDITKMSAWHRDRYRGINYGYIFQMFNLVPYLSVHENIALGCSMHSERRKRVKPNMDEAIHSLTDGLGITSLLKKKVTELSVGQQQRVAAARAFLGDPPLVIADEPTSALDDNNREDFIKLLFNMADRCGSTVVFVSHDKGLESMFDRTLRLLDINREARS
tara:strand:+ start:786 stop:1472 length:687 start_codon:yes stop_codon:yes gene_type:complete